MLKKKKVRKKREKFKLEKLFKSWIMDRHIKVKILAWPYDK
jgi:hypothetical protein